MTVVQRGVCFAPDDPTLEEDPTWVSLHEYEDQGLKVQAWSIDRGRLYELDKTQAGTCSASILDTGGILDATNPSGPFYGKLDPLKQVAIFLTNPVTNIEKCLFRGFLADIQTSVDVSMGFMRHTLNAVDGFEVVANSEAVPDSGGDHPGNVFYEDSSVDDRIHGALTDAQWPEGLRRIFTGNVTVRETVYAPRTQHLQVVLEAADAEFPGVANVFVDKDGNFTFHGRLARFHPDVSEYGISHWRIGDGAAADGDEDTVPIATPFTFERSKAHIYNAVLAAPQGIAGEDISGQLVTDPTSITERGVRSLSFENLLTLAGQTDGNDANAETLLFADYYRDNYAVPRTRVKQLSLTNIRDTRQNLPAWWAMVCGVDISDLASLDTTHPGGGGFNEDYFVEGVHYSATPLRNEYPHLAVALDLSPRSYYDANPFEDA